MAIETELKLRVPPRQAARLARQLATLPVLQGIEAKRQHLINVYYDTPQLELLQRRIALRHRRKGWHWLLTVKTAEAASGGLARRSEWESTSAPGAFDFSHVDDPALRDWLTGLVPQLTPIFRTDFNRDTWVVPASGDSRIEIAFDRGSIESGQQQQALCELELELLPGADAGDPADLFHLAMHLVGHQDGFQLHPEMASKAERGYRLFTGLPVHALRAGVPRLAPGMTPLEAFRAIAGECLSHLQGNENGIIVGGLGQPPYDPEFVHQARVAIRRLRAALKLFSPLLPPGFAAAWNPPWRELAAVLGEARNYDVLLAETLPPLHAAFPDNAELTRLQRRCEQQQQQAHRRAALALQAPSYSHLLLDFSGALWSLPCHGESAETGDVTAFALERLPRRQRQVERLAGRIAELDASQRHGLRIACKKLRYALEFFTPLVNSSQLKQLRAALGNAQDILGELNDLATAEHLLLIPDARPGLLAGWLAGRGEVLAAALPTALGPLCEQLQRMRNKTEK